MSYQPERSFKLLIYESEYRQIQAWTNKYEDLETGGDLFGLWQDEHTAVVQLVVGPGKRCRRTSTSFYQDIDYLTDMGDVLTKEEGLCHIGEWHSHHTLSLSRPSVGDERTIWSNMDRYGLSRFFLFIANISTTWKWSAFNWKQDDTAVNGFLFEVDRHHQQRLPLLEAEFIFLKQESPFRSIFINAIQEGAESMNSAQDQLGVVVRKCRKLESGWKKALQEKQELQTSLTATRKELQSVKQQSYEIKTSLTTVIRARDKLESSLAGEKAAHEETRRYLWDSEQRLNAQRQAREETERRLRSIEQRSHELETSLAKERQARRDLKADLADEQKAHEETRTSKLHNSTLATVQQEFQEHRSSRDTNCVWSLDRNDMTLSDVIIGEGAWWRVLEGEFRGLKVGVKEIHPAILSPNIRRRLEHEMNIAFECRHPCLLQFIGATNDDQSPLVVTELLDTSLRAVLHHHERPLEPSEITTIALNVAEGLNYLHLKHPVPIIHRDVNSSNVLLWRNGAEWGAKLSNPLTDNFLRQSMTFSPLDACYVAPESQMSQTLKVDVYSFGVLLCEMKIRELPADVNQRNNQIDNMDFWYKRLIKSCLKETPMWRPSMTEVIEKIKNLRI